MSNQKSVCSVLVVKYIYINVLEIVVKYIIFRDILLKVTRKAPPMKEQNFDKMSDNVAAETLMRELEKRDQSVMWTLFHGLHRSVIQCETCGNRSLTFEPFSILTLSFPTNGRSSLKVGFNRDVCKFSH